MKKPLLPLIAVFAAQSAHPLLGAEPTFNIRHFLVIAAANQVPASTGPIFDEIVNPTNTDRGNIATNPFAMDFVPPGSNVHVNMLLAGIQFRNWAASATPTGVFANQNGSGLSQVFEIEGTNGSEVVFSLGTVLTTVTSSSPQAAIYSQTSSSYSTLGFGIQPGPNGIYQKGLGDDITIGRTYQPEYPYSVPAVHVISSSPFSFNAVLSGNQTPAESMAVARDKATKANGTVTGPYDLIFTTTFTGRSADGIERQFSFSDTVNVVPEPGSTACIALGLGALGLQRLRRRR